MNKTILALLSVSLISTAVFGKSVTVKGTYTGSECGDYCYMIFKTKKGEIAPMGSDEQYPNVKEGKTYTVTYEEKMEFLPEAGGKVKIQVVKSIK